MAHMSARARVWARVFAAVVGTAIWTGARSASAQRDGASAIVIAPPRAGSWQLGLRYTWDVQSVPDGAVMGVGGIGLAGGVRVTDRIYLGAVAESESISRMTGGGAPSYDTLRAGGELRYYLHDGAASVARHDWIGLRYGVETYDWGATIGRFADVTLGTDVDLGAVGLGLYLTAGLSRQPSSAFAQPVAGPVTVTFTTGTGPYDADTDVMTTSPYVGFGMSLLFQ